MNNDKVAPVLYEEDRRIKITRFFEVAAYLTKENLWDEVEKLLISNELIGPRITLDQHLGNAVKIIIARNASATKSTFEKDDIAQLAVRCGSMRTPPDPQRPNDSLDR
ncbi:hypothetical protein [Pseudomonas migulae]|uniref:Uncharacterized protein n=1 Tax=Pseudomonas migulae TaxID=78543 RepID=A0ABY8MYU1_9PSED|nr:hypothetical protein [Pseudomonas migulae]WGK92575.1 hypothetical protein MOQ58_10445 [Pseudomonas migulae]